MNRQVTSAEMATAAGITVETFYEYRRRGQVPEPDGTLGNRPWWRPSTRDRWLRARRSVGRPRMLARDRRARLD